MDGELNQIYLRKRMRHFFNKQIQNANDRLKSMLRNPLKPINAKALADVLNLIEKCDLCNLVDPQTHS